MDQPGIGAGDERAADSKRGDGSLPQPGRAFTRANADYAAEYARLHPEPPPGRPAVSASLPAAVQPVSNGLVLLPRSLTAGETRTNPKDGLTYVWIPQGNFRMGCSRGDNEYLSSEESAIRRTRECRAVSFTSRTSATTASGSGAWRICLDSLLFSFTSGEAAGRNVSPAPRSSIS
jgi:hypothetical protein